MNKPQYGYIYKTTNLINDKVYIGKHKNSDFNDKYFGSGKNLISAIKKYGIENFTTEVLEICYDEKSLNEAEIKYIDFYKKKYKENCYNIAKGGNGGNLIKHYLPEEKELVYKKMVLTRKVKGIGLGETNPMYKSGEKGIHPYKSKRRDKETRLKISKSLKGNTPWNKGLKILPEKTDKELEEEKINKYLRNNLKTPIKVTNVVTNEVKYFDTKKSCEEYYKINIKYRLSVGKLENEDLYFERISKEEYIDKYTKEVIC